jgi:hypothetical protein
MKTIQITLIALTLCSLLSSCGYTPQEAFSDALAKPVPQSVTIVSAKSEVGWERTEWLHFKIGPPDLAAILSADRYEKDVSTGAGERYMKMKHPTWWKPEGLGPFTVHKKWFDKSKDDYWCRVLYVNTQSNEVFCWASEIVR